MMMITLTKSMLLDKEPQVVFVVALPAKFTIFRTHKHTQREFCRQKHTIEAYRPIDIAERQKLFWKKQKQKHTNNCH